MKGEQGEAPLRVNELGWMKGVSPLWRVNVIRVNQIRVIEGWITLMKDESKINPRKKINTTNIDIIKFIWNNLKNESRLKYLNWILRFWRLSSSVLSQPGLTHFQLWVEYTNDKSVKFKKMYHSNLSWYVLNSGLTVNGLTKNSTVKCFTCI